MPRVADYIILADGKFKLPKPLGGKKIKFNAPAGFHAKSRSVLTFVIDLDDADDYKFKIRINGTEVWNGRFNGGKYFAMQEVIPANLIGRKNLMEIFYVSGDGNVYLSDIVLLVQVDV